MNDSAPSTSRRPWRCGLLAAAFACVCAVLLVAKPGAAPASPAVRDFTSKSFGEIRKANAGYATVVAFWSVHCEPCRGEMTALVELRRDFPRLRVVLVAADAPELRREVESVLGQFGDAATEKWHFADEAVERLRYSVDRSWRGELPRSYFIDSTGKSTTRSGAVDLDWMKAWAKRTLPKSEE